MPPKVQRLKIYPGVTATMVAGVLRDFVTQEKIHCIATFFSDILSSNVCLGPRVLAMVKYASLAESLIYHAKNGVLGHLCVKAGLEELFLVLPNIHTKIPKKTTLILELSLGIRTLLSWYREYGKNGATTKQVNKVATLTQRAIIQKACEKLVLTIPKDHMQDRSEQNSGQNSGRKLQKFGELSFCNFSDLI